MVLGGPPDPAARGKFNHDLKVRAGQGQPAGTGNRQGDRDSMTRPEDNAPTDTTAPLQDETAPADQAPEALQREPLHFVVVLLLLADIVFGLGLAVFAEKVLAFRPMAIMGCGLAVLGLGILGYFVLVGGGKRSRW
jgi:hypothetical protein